MQPAEQHERPERRRATVLFCDLGGYTAWNEREEPEEVAAVMDRIRQHAALTFESFGGVANQFVGDEIIGLFGVTQSHEDDPRRAVAAAQALHAFVREQLGRAAGQARELCMHSGIETGLIFARARDPRSGLWEITGDTVNVAARLRALAGPDEVLIGPGTQAAVAQFFATEALPAVSVRGRQQPVVAHRVRAAAASSRFEVSERRGLTQYVGRGPALERLHAAWWKAAGGDGRLVTIEGPAGIGKTRLLHELRRLVQASAAEGSDETPQILHGRCQDFGDVPPYQPFIEALRELDLDAYALSDSARDALRCLREPGTLPERFREAAGEQLRDAIGAALFDLCASLSGRRPLLIVFEDWQLADEPSRVALRHVAQGIDRCRALIAVNFRPGESGASLRPLSALHETLMPFDEPSTAAIAQGVLRAASLPPELSRHIFERSLGNPFFAEEVARSLLESGALLRSPGSVALVKPPAELETPATVQALVRERVDRLPAVQRDLLGAASVIGVEFAPPLVARLLRLQRATHGGGASLSDDGASSHAGGAADLSTLLEELERQGLLYRSSEDGSHYHFGHAITQEVVYESLPLYARRALHELVARSSEEDCLAQGREPPCELLAHHYARSPDAAKALHYAALAADKAWRAFALQQADAHYRRALALIDVLLARGPARFDAAPSDDPALAAQRLDLTLRWARVGVYNPRADQARALRVAHEAARSAGDARGACLCLDWLSWIEYALGDQPASLAVSLEFFEAAQRLGDDALVAQALTNAGLCQSVATDYAKAADFIERGIALRGRFAGTAYAYALGTMAMLRGDQGDFERAFELAQRAVTIADQSGLLTLQGPVLTQRGMIEAWSGAFEACANTGAAVHDIAEHIDGNYLRAMGRSLEGYASYMLSGDRSAIDLQREAVTLLERHGISLHMSWCLALLAESLALSSQHEEARASAEAALRRAAEGDRLGEAHALRVLITLHGASDPAAAERYYQRALEVADTKQSPRDRALGNRCFGLLLRERGERERGDALVLAADHELARMGCEVGERLRAHLPP